MDANTINDVMEQALEYWSAQTGKVKDDSFDPVETVGVYCGFTSEELNEISEYLEGFIAHNLAHSIARMVINGEGMEPAEIVRTSIGSCLPVCMILTRWRAGGNRANDSDPSFTTAMAEVRLGKAKSEDEDLDAIWPQPLVESVISNWSPEDAFRIGVLCGHRD